MHKTNKEFVFEVIHPGYFLLPKEQVAPTTIEGLQTGKQIDGPATCKKLNITALNTMLLITCLSAQLLGPYTNKPIKAQNNTPSTETFVPIQQPTESIDMKLASLGNVLDGVIQSVNEQNETLGHLLNQNSTPSSDAVAENLQDPDLPVVTVTADKANLRSGPSKSATATMAVKGGTRLIKLAVEGDWLRVIAPSGEQLWILADLTAHA